MVRKSTYNRHKELVNKISKYGTYMVNISKDGVDFDDVECYIDINYYDDFLYDNIKDISRNISPDIIKLIQDNKSSNTLLISDSASIKKCPEAIDGLYVTNSIPKHTGRCKDSDSIKDTLVDFLLVSRSTNIKTYSCYSWVSGFIYWAHIIYNIPTYGYLYMICDIGKAITRQSKNLVRFYVDNEYEFYRKIIKKTSYDLACF